MYIQESPTLCFCLSVLFLFWGAVLFGPLHDGDSTKIAQADLCTSCMNGGSTRAKKRGNSEVVELRKKVFAFLPWFTVFTEPPEMLSRPAVSWQACCCPYFNFSFPTSSVELVPTFSHVVHHPAVKPCAVIMVEPLFMSMLSVNLILFFIHLDILVPFSFPFTHERADFRA